ncbi:MAG: hypothetical protein PHH54_02130 [Candidatus Nanoarchaeia archaeon]|nr:hypothetical protein [Candidatus Nanoarchaeia archaeon]MDD5740760.1 hypothetical protein [Candidatus Nanoarchaeia archaeon]
MSVNLLLQTLPSYHKVCSTKLEERTVPVDGRVLSLNPYPVKYCPECKVYIFGNAESKNPERIGKLITLAQEQTNLKTNGSKFRVDYLQKINKDNL